MISTISNSNGHDADFIQNRIEWKADQHGVPFDRTDYWRDAPEPLVSILPQDFERPVVFTMGRNGEATVIGTEEIAILKDQGITRFALDEIEGLSSANIAEGKQKTEFDAVSVKIRGTTHHLPTEAGKACFAIWSILLMISRMQRNGPQE